MSDTATEKKVALCALHGDRKPAFCVEYPRVDQYMPEECTYTFNGSERRGECSCGTAACCNTPRVDGEPGGAAMPAIAGGKPCKYIVWKGAEPAVVKEASVQPSSPAPQDLQALVGGTNDS